MMNYLPTRWATLALAGTLLCASLGMTPDAHAQTEAEAPPSVAEVVAAAPEAAAPTIAQPAEATTPVDPLEEIKAGSSAMRVGLDTVWVILCGMLVFFMNAGFGLVESGLCQAKNTVNILAKNFIVFGIASMSYYFIGWGLMFGDGNMWIGTQGLFFVSGADNSPALGAGYEAMNPFSSEKYEGVYSSVNWASIPLWTKFFFQLVFAGTAATIVSGAVAERIKFGSFMVFSFVLVALIYPISGHWIWGGGILGMTPTESGLGAFFGNFRDFAGSTTVHSVGGWAALAGVIVLGPRAGKYLPNGKVRPIPGHSMTSAALGVFILWLGWFGFNPGSTMSAGDGKAIAHILVNTNIAAAMGALGATITSWLLLKKPDLSMILNGALAGLVAITAGCGFTSIGAGAIIGLIGGVLVVFSVLFFDRVKIDDPVGAISVHLVNGIWGTLALGLFYNTEVAASVAGLDTGLGAGAQLLQQIKGIILVGVVVFGLSLLLWMAVKAAMGIRVSAEEEAEGLDIGEHGNEAYPDFGRVTHG